MYHDTPIARITGYVLIKDTPYVAVNSTPLRTSFVRRFIDDRQSLNAERQVYVRPGRHPPKAATATCSPCRAGFGNRHSISSRKVLYTMVYGRSATPPLDLACTRILKRVMLTNLCADCTITWYPFLRGAESDGACLAVERTSLL